MESQSQCMEQENTIKLMAFKNSSKEFSFHNQFWQQTSLLNHPSEKTEPEAVVMRFVRWYVHTETVSRCFFFLCFNVKILVVASFNMIMNYKEKQF